MITTPEIQNRGVAASASLSALAGSRVVITGGASGIGLAVARRVAAAGGRVLLAGRNTDRLNAARDEIGMSVADTLVLDVTDEAAVAAAFAGAGALDHIVAAAAGSVRGPLVELETAKARVLFEWNFWGQYYCIKYGAPILNPKGSIVLFSGWISRKPMVGTSTLAAVDAAIEALARVVSLEVAPIRVNAISPGMIDTPLWRARLSEPEQRSFFARVGARLPVGRAGLPDDIAHAVQFLLENGFTTGSVVDVDGGQR
jgi:NAD(P)-dependent dehydrogenase (short-subunit alcohol dehydrogenase family)